MPGWTSARSLVLAVSLLAVVVAGGGPSAPRPAPAAATFARLVASLSEPGGYFDTDNLISNERSYLAVLPELGRVTARGGGYVGVGPDQNFSYIAAIRPSIAFIIDLRRDNLLLHLLFKALFTESPARLEYLAALTGRPLPADAAAWEDRSIDAIADYLDATPALTGEARERLGAALLARVASFGVPLTPADTATIRRFHDRFVSDGLSLRFQSLGRPPQFYYPTYRQLIVATDAEGRRGSFLASPTAYAVVRALQLRDAVIPVTGNLAGPHALRAIGDELRARGVVLQALYASNVEFYLYRDGSLGRFVDNLGTLPAAASAVVIRSEFGGGESRSSLAPLAGILDRTGRRRRP